MSTASLPPPSMTSGVRVSAHAAMTLRPVAAEPVKASLSTPALHSAAPVEPSPVMVWMSGWEAPSESQTSASHTPTPGVNSLGLNTTALPAAIA